MHGGKDGGGDGGKADEVDGQEHGIGGRLPQFLQEQDGAGRVGADEEHVEPLLRQLRQRKVEHERHQREQGEHRRAAPKGAQGLGDSAARPLQHAHQHQRHVPYHRMDIDEPVFDEHHVRVQQHGRPAEGAVRPQKAADIAAQASFGQKEEGEAGIGGRGAELPGEDVPRVLPVHAAFADVHRIEQLFEDL